MSNFLKEAGTKRILKLIKELENRLNSSLHDTNILSTVSECTASTNANDVAGASALSELNDSLHTQN